MIRSKIKEITTNFNINIPNFHNFYKPFNYKLSKA